MEGFFIGVLAGSPVSFTSADTVNTSQSCEEALSEVARGACAVLPGHAFVTVAFSLGEGLD